MRVLVTGASGYVGRRLVPVLLDRGHEVVAAFSTPGSAERFPWRDRVTVAGMDVRNPGQVTAAVEGVEAVYYLIHAMAGPDFVTEDRQSAHHLAHAAIEHDVGRMVYLSGLVPRGPLDRLSPHLRSRHEVEQILAASGVPTTTLRAAVLLGSGSTSFEIVRQVSERLPLRTVPAWMRSEVQPMAVTDALEVLAGCLDVEPVTRSYDIGGPERLSYRELLDRYAALAGLARPEVTLPFAPTALVGWLAGQLTDVPSSTVEALVESLHHDMVCAEQDFRADLLPAAYELVGVDDAIRRALARSSGSGPHDPLGPVPGDPEWAGGEIHYEAGAPVRAPRSPAASLLLGLPRIEGLPGTDRSPGSPEGGP
jgi:uncharacterized protein YbjT (DUF2867 family)